MRVQMYGALYSTKTIVINRAAIPIDATGRVPRSQGSENNLFFILVFLFILKVFVYGLTSISE